MLLTKQQLRAHVMTSTDEERYALSHVKVEPDGRVSATNGHLAVLVTPKGRDVRARTARAASAICGGVR